jgi:hypothetical protein
MFLPALNVGKAIAAQKNTFHMRLELQKLVPSSRLINVPPKKKKIVVDIKYITLHGFFLSV